MTRHKSGADLGMLRDTTVTDMSRVWEVLQEAAGGGGMGYKASK